MDFILLYSKYSTYCSYLFQEIPLLTEKAVCIDNPAARLMISKLPYKIKSVPALLITDGMDNILKVIEGAEQIKNWIILTTYSLSSPPENMPEKIEQPLLSSEINHTPIYEDELLPPSEDYTLKTEKVAGVKNLAEELQRQRDSFIESTEPPRHNMQ